MSSGVSVGRARRARAPHAPSPPGVADYLGTQVRAAKAIRKIDADVPIFIEANEWDSPRGYPELVPVDVSNVIYEVHM